MRENLEFSKSVKPNSLRFGILVQINLHKNVKWIFFEKVSHQWILCLHVRFYFSREFHFHYSLLLIGFKLQIFIDTLTEAWYECFVGLFFILSFKMNPYLFLIEKSSQVASCNTFFFFLKTYFNESRSNWFILKLSKNYYVRTF